MWLHNTVLGVWREEGITYTLIHTQLNQQLRELRPTRIHAVRHGFFSNDSHLSITIKSLYKTSRVIY